MRIPVDEKNLRLILSDSVLVLTVGERSGRNTLLSICKVCFTNVRAI